LRGKCWRLTGCHTEQGCSQRWVDIESFSIALELSYGSKLLLHSEEDWRTNVKAGARASSIRR
jgi:hypothetical protein